MVPQKKNVKPKSCKKPQASVLSESTEVEW